MFDIFLLLKFQEKILNLYYNGFGTKLKLVLIILAIKNSYNLSI